MNNTNGYPYMLGVYDNSSSSNTTLIVNADPIASIKMSASVRNPYGYLIATGEIFDKACYPDLQLAIQNNYIYSDGPSGTIGANDFKIPNLVYGSNRFPMASDLQIVSSNLISNLTAASLYGGASNITLSSSNLPPHIHQIGIGNNVFAYNNGSGNSAAAVNGANAPTKTNADIYNASGTLVVASNATPSAVNIINPYTTVYSLIHATSVIPSTYQTGCVNIDSTNNRFWTRLTINTIVTYTVAVQLASGSFTPVQFLENLRKSVSVPLLAALGQQYVLGGYTLNSQGKYVYKMYCGQTGASQANSVQLTFNFTQNYNVSIPQAVLDKTADTLGYYTRTSITYNVGNLTSQRSYISPPKAMKIYFGSIEDGSMNANNLPNITISF